MHSILVTGATGTVGRQVVDRLRRRDVPVRALVRDRQRAVAVLGPDVELAVGDFSDARSLRAAVDGVDQMYLACANHPLQVSWESAAVDAAAAAGVRRIVKLSALDSAVGSPVAFADAHGRIAAHLAVRGVEHVLLKPTFSMANLLGAAASVQQADAIVLPAAGAKIAMIDPGDVAEVAAAVLADPAHNERSYLLTGPEAVTFDDVAAQLSDVLGRRIGFMAVPDDAALAQLVSSGAPEWFAKNLVAQFGLLRSGTQAETWDDVRVLTGREPRSVAAFLRDHAGAFEGR